MRFSLSNCLVAAIVFMSACRPSGSGNQLFTLAENTGLVFTNQVTDNNENNIFKYRNFYNGGGVAIGDVNNDGLADVFLTSNMGSNKLFLNKGNFTFEDISTKAGFGPKQQWSTGVVMVDINNDGWLDIYVCNANNTANASLRRNQLFINNQNLSFSDSATVYGLDNDGYTTQASFFDYDLDGDLDCFMINNSPLPVNTLNYINARNVRAENSPVADSLKGGGDHLFRNDNGRFVEVSEKAGIHGSLISFGMGVTVSDINKDGWPDVYVSNDFFERDYLYVNQQNGTFKDEFEERIGHSSLSSMGMDIADINNDGYPDIFTADMLPADYHRLKTTTSFDNIEVYKLKEKSGFYHQFTQNALQLNNGNGKFKEIANMAGVSASDWSWGELMFDADNDGYTDIYVCNGIQRELTNLDFINFFANDMVQRAMEADKKHDDIDNIIKKIPSNPLLNRMFHNKGDLTFAETGKEWGFSTTSFSNGAAYGDLDNDGDIDLVVNNVNQPAFVYRNNSREKNKSHYISFSLEGKKQNRFAIGAKVNLFMNGNVLSREIMPARGFQSSVDYRAVIGTGETERIDSVQIIWPDATYSIHKKLQTDSLYRISQVNTVTLPYKPAEPSFAPLFTETTSSFQKHTENSHIDFYAERNIPRSLSAEGPKAATADINGDGLTDLFICGADKQGGKVYLQDASGKFTEKSQPAFLEFAAYEDVAAVFFDADRDGDMDLFIGSGGNESGVRLNHRLFINDGKANFTHLPGAFPPYGFNTGVAAPYDVDGDGDVDLFVGSRSVLFSYGQLPKSYLYINDGKGHFTDGTDRLTEQFNKLGMITSAAWADIEGDAKQELIVAGEWMAPMIFGWKNGKLKPVANNLDKMSGWWQSIAVADLDGDGKKDIVLGNMGENGNLRPSQDKPVKLWINDFYRNGKKQKILTRTVDGKDYPVFLKNDLEEQLPVLRKSKLQHDEFAKKTFHELFDAKEIKAAEQYTYNYCTSIIAWNNGGGKFTVQAMPKQVQVSSINTIQALDIDNNKQTDLLMGGNQFGFLPQFGRLDAGTGTILLNKGKRQFTVVPDNMSGLYVTGQTRDIALLPGKTGQQAVFLRNNDYPVLLKLNAKYPAAGR